MGVEVVGLIPAAGLAKRIAPLPGSKELFPIGFREVEVEGQREIRAKVVSQYLLDNMFRAGARKIWIVLGRHKSDIMHYYGDGEQFGGRIAYLIIENMGGMPYTLDQAWPWLNEDTVLFGMPDTIFTPPDTFAQMLERHQRSGFDVTLGVFPTVRPEKLCPVEMDETGRVIGMVDKPPHSATMNTWGCACWSPRFTEFMHHYLVQLPAATQEVVLAAVFRAAIRAGLRTEGLFFNDGDYIDIGTPEDLAMAVRRFSTY